MRRLLLLLATLLLATPAIAEPVAKPIVIGEAYALASKALGGERTVNVWTPPSYAKGEQRYPVLYLIDGGMAQDFHHISGLAQLGAISWLTQEFIVVGVETVDRRRELAFPVERDAKLRAEYPTAGSSDLFRRYLIDEVKPMVEARYRTSGEDVLIGESLAGLFIVETLLKTPDAFDTYIAMDPSLWWDDGRLTDEAAGLLAAHPAKGKPRVWISIGKETLQQPRFADRLAAALRARGTALELHWEPRPALSHATIYHPTAWDALQALFPRPE
ncbi:alpha/beta hydrolase [Allosphingosinicella indica]|uniref:Alpha/beta hydrolase n=1 Tax=Allosphingosinicella indica TaxID=941907 RepID=A0A1X7G9A4_9SPHN|nr:alpha/beta hydrolase-fold protein [Allosphingosinicella indica]SMF66169.1 hypothetical protein SAMN06295910_1371 [Allosphingosinicella indica]